LRKKKGNLAKEGKRERKNGIRKYRVMGGAEALKYARVGLFVDGAHVQAFLLGTGCVVRCTALWVAALNAGSMTDFA